MTGSVFVCAHLSVCCASGQCAQPSRPPQDPCRSRSEDAAAQTASRHMGLDGCSDVRRTYPCFVIMLQMVTTCRQSLG